VALFITIRWSNCFESGLKSKKMADVKALAEQLVGLKPVLQNIMSTTQLNNRINFGKTKNLAATPDLLTCSTFS
jgi:hypothetical protein